MGTWWTETIKMPSFGRLEKDIATDVLIIGGGMAGVLCAYMLATAGVDCVLIESGRIGGGVTARTTAKITSQHGLIYDQLTDLYGAEKAKQYWRANEESLAWYRRLCTQIDCDFETKDAYVYSTDDRDALEQERMTLERLGIDVEWVREVPLPLTVEGALKFPRQAQFHPLKFLAGIAPGLPIYEHTKACSFDGTCVHTDCATVKANRIVVTTHFPLFNKHGAYFLKLYQHRSYVLALEHAPDVEGMYVDAKDTGLSFRNVGSRLLLGGGAHRTGKQGGGFRELLSFARRQYPHCAVTEQWATQDCMSLDGIPYIGRYASSTPHVYVATGFNKWGMTSSMTAARLLCDMVRGIRNPYEDLFSPSRRVWHPQLAVNVWESACHLLKPTVPRCPHMGCALTWNAQERSWDCPCHGSRFSEDGALLDNPATGDLR